MEYEIIHEQEKKMFKIRVDGYIAYVEYSLHDDSLDVIHTFVPSPLEGKGVAAALVEAAYDFASHNGLKAAATCSYAVRWLARHPT